MHADMELNWDNITASSATLKEHKKVLENGTIQLKNLMDEVKSGKIELASYTEIEEVIQRCEDGIEKNKILIALLQKAIAVKELCGE